jgi:dihydrofolate reductase
VEQAEGAFVEQAQGALWADEFPACHGSNDQVGPHSTAIERPEKGVIMAKVLLDMAVSLDGYVGGPGGADVGLYDWYFNPSGVSRPVIDELIATTGAIVIGRGAYITGEEAGGWDDTPYAVPHFVITHHPPQVSSSWVEFVFVTEGVEAAIDEAKKAAGDRYTTIGGGSDIARQALAAGLIDELQLHVVPLLAGDGVRLFDSFDHGWQLTKVRVIDGPNVTHLRYRVDGAASRASG